MEDFGGSLTDDLSGVEGRGRASQRRYSLRNRAMDRQLEDRAPSVGGVSHDRKRGKVGSPRGKGKMARTVIRGHPTMHKKGSERFGSAGNPSSAKRAAASEASNTTIDNSDDFHPVIDSVVSLAGEQSDSGVSDDVQIVAEVQCVEERVRGLEEDDDCVVILDSFEPTETSWNSVGYKKTELDFHKCMNCCTQFIGIENFASHMKRCHPPTVSYTQAYRNIPRLRPLGTPSPPTTQSPPSPASTSNDGDDDIVFIESEFRQVKEMYGVYNCIRNNFQSGTDAPCNDVLNEEREGGGGGERKAKDRAHCRLLSSSKEECPVPETRAIIQALEPPIIEEMDDGCVMDSTKPTEARIDAIQEELPVSSDCSDHRCAQMKAMLKAALSLRTVVQEMEKDVLKTKVRRLSLSQHTLWSGEDSSSTSSNNASASNTPLMEEIGHLIELLGSSEHVSSCRENQIKGCALFDGNPLYAGAPGCKDKDKPFTRKYQNVSSCRKYQCVPLSINMGYRCDSVEFLRQLHLSLPKEEDGT